MDRAHELIRSWTGKLRALSPRATLVLGFALFLVYAFPGYMSTDSVNQLLEARTGHFSDAHPPLMSAEWWLLDRIIGGPILMLLLQGTIFLGGLYVLLMRVMTSRAAAWTAIGILLFPPVLTTMAVIWKDSQMAAYLVAGIAAVVQPQLRTRLVGLGLLVAACAMRHNAVAAVVPLVVILFQWRTGLARWKRISILAAAAVFTVGATFAVGRLLTAEHVKLTPVFYDIVGQLAYTRDRSDDDLRHVLRGTPLVVDEGIQKRAVLLFAQRGSYRTTQGDERMFDYPRTDEQWSALYRAWKELALDDPMAYLASHWAVYRRMLGLSDEPLRAPVWNLFLEDEDQMPAVSHYAGHSWAQVWIGITCFYWLSDYTPLFEQYVYALIGLALLVVCCRDRLTFALLISGLAYELSFFPVGVEPDYRYSHWMITCVVIASVILFVERLRRNKP